MYHNQILKDTISTENLVPFRGGSLVGAAVLQHPQPKKINLKFSHLYQKNKKCKNFKPILLYDKKKHKKYKKKQKRIMRSIQYVATLLAFTAFPADQK